MTELVKMITENGIMVILSGIFIWDWVVNKKANNKALNEISNSNNNIAKALEMLNGVFMKHDDNAHEIKDDVREIKVMQNSMDSKIDIIIKK